MRLIDAILQYPDIRIFNVLDSDIDDKNNWDVLPHSADILVEYDEYNYGYYVVKAKNILADGRVNDCYIDMNLPERISDLAFFRRDNNLDVRYHHEFDGEIICAVPIDCYGVYELFYSRIAPEIGVNVLRQGLVLSKRKYAIAEDLGYILRDEQRFEEAAEMFQIAVDEGPSSYFLYGELAACYEEIGQMEKAKKYAEMYRIHE